MAKKSEACVDLKRKWCIAVELGPTDQALLRFAHLIDQHIHPKEWDLVHIVPEYDTIQFNYEPVTGSMHLEFGFREESVARLERLAAEFFEAVPDRRVVTMIEAGDPEKQLMSERYVAGANHLMIGKKQESASSMEFIIRLTRNHRMPVWIIPEHAKAKLDRILVPVDFSPNSIRALRNADHLIRNWDDPVALHVLHVYSPPNLNAAKLMRSRSAYHDELEAFRMEALRDLLRTHIGERGEEATISIVNRAEPGIAQYIVEYAEDIHADLVVMGAKGYSRIERLLMGSVTEKWLRMNNRAITWIIK